MTPNLFIPGAPKCATTALAHALASHSQIEMPHTVPDWRSYAKEPGFFLSPGVAAERLAQCPDLYSGGSAYRIDATPSYCTVPDAMQTMKELCPDARYIYLMREPVARCVSRFNHFLALSRSRPGFVDHWELDADLSFEQNLLREMIGLCYRGGTLLEPGRYAETMGLYLSDPEGLVVFTEDLRADPGGMLGRLQEWLGLPVEDLEISTMNSRENIVETKPGTLAMLREYYRPHNARLRELIGRELPDGWAV